MKPFEEWMNQMNISKTAAMYIVEKDTKSGITTWTYIPEEKKEKKMKETNLQHYKEELKKIFNEEYRNPNKMVDRIKSNLDPEIVFYHIDTCTDNILDWMALPYKEPILDKVERKYLSDVIRPFRKNVINICKLFYYEGNKQYISIQVRYESGYSDYVNLPNFNADTMYKGMKVEKGYTLEELDL